MGSASARQGLFLKERERMSVWIPKEILGVRRLAAKPTAKCPMNIGSR
jgi:hypothetical protein